MAIELEVTKRPKTSGRPTPARARVPFSRSAVSARDRTFFTERLALLLDTGTPLYSSLEILQLQATNPALARVIGTLRDDIAGGQPFSRALEKHPEIFSSTYVNLIAASEQGGFTADVLKQLIDLDEKAARLRMTVVSAFSYPAFLAVFSTVVVLFVLLVVFPKFAEMFRAIRDQLPAITVFLMTWSDIVRQFWAFIVLGAAAALGTVYYWAGTPAGVALVDRVKLELPLVKEIFVELYLTQSMRVLGLSLGHGVSVPDALRACRDVVSNSRFRRLMDTVERHVNEGRGLSPGFEQSEIIPSLTKQMVATGEESGTLPLVLTRIADFYERELTRKLTTFSKLAEPLMLLVMGVVVGLIVASLILPIFKLSKAVH